MGDARFGTDGVRGLANASLTPELALALGRAAARVLGCTSVVIGRDTRRSGPMLLQALAAGFASEGVDVIDVGVLPTPGIASLCASRDLPGAVVSASHNPFADNGIKVLGHGGTKLADEDEAAIEAELERVLGQGAAGDARPTGARVGDIKVEPELAQAYIEHLLAAVPPRALAGLRLVVDCAHGAASPVAEEVLASLGAEVEVLHAAPDGTNINAAAGSTHPEALIAAVQRVGADLGLALDGDADRLIAVDGQGNLVDGDRMLALFATDMAARGQLVGDAVVVTVMSNLGFRRAMAAQGIRCEVVPVGDRHVLQALLRHGLSLGGEQSGHVIFPGRATTGDGLLTGILLCDLVVRAGEPLAALAASAFESFPQCLVAVEVPDRDALGDCGPLDAAIADAEAALGEWGRVLVRASGTEPVIRIMVEAESADDAAAWSSRLAGLVASELGGTLR
jgi:phosphoglucosamine mutase